MTLIIDEGKLINPTNSGASNKSDIEASPLFHVMLSVIPSITFVKLMKQYRIPARAYYWMSGLTGSINGKGYTDIKSNPNLRLCEGGKLLPAGKYAEALYKAYNEALESS